MKKFCTTLLIFNLSIMCVNITIDNEKESNILYKTYDNILDVDFNKTDEILSGLIGDNYPEIEFVRPIVTLFNGTKEYCYYVDFIDSNGYVIFDDENIYDSKSSGDFEILKNRNIEYSSSDGFVIYNENTKLYNLIDINSGENIDENICCTSITSSYSSVDGSILTSDLTNYISSVHPDWTLEDTKIIDNFSKRSMFTTSLYVDTQIYDDGSSSSYTEGNCGPNSMYSYLYNLPTVISPSGIDYQYNQNLLNGRNIVNKTDYFKNKYDYFYAQLYDNYYDVDENGNYLSTSTGTSTPKLKRHHWTQKSIYDSSISNMTDLYWNVRTESIKKGFDPRFGLNMYDYSERIIEDVASCYYDYNIDIVRTDTVANVLSNISYGIPVVVAAGNSMTYNNHGMVIYGYKKYSYEVTSGWWLWENTETKYAYLWLVDDGWEIDNDSTQKWYDPNRGSSNTYFCTNRNSLTWPTC